MLELPLDDLRVDVCIGSWVVVCASVFDFVWVAFRGVVLGVVAFVGLVCHCLCYL